MILTEQLILKLITDMNLSNQGEGLILVDSQCWEKKSSQRSSLYKVVSKNLKDGCCEVHQQEVNYFYKKDLMCHKCFLEVLRNEKGSIGRDSMKKYEFYYHLSTILNHPIVLMIEESELLGHPLEIMELVLSSYKQFSQKRKTLDIQKTLIDSFTSRIKSRINKLCDQISANYSKIEQNIMNYGQLKDDLKNINTMYEQQLMDMLGSKFMEGSKAELEQIFIEYSNQNQNPLETILDNLDSFMTSLSTSPLIDTKALEDIYTTVTDQKLWKTSEIIHTLSETKQFQPQTADLIISNDEIILQGEYTLNMADRQLSLLLDSKPTNTLDIQLDSLYRLPNYKLLGVNYDKMVIINYFDQLTIEKEFQIPGCTDVLPFDNHIIVISNHNLLKVDLQTQNILGFGAKLQEIEIQGQRGFQFWM